MPDTFGFPYTANVFEPGLTTGKPTDGRAESAQRERTVQTSEEVAAAVRKEMFPEEEWQPEGSGIEDKLREYISANVKPKARDFSHLGQEVEALHLPGDASWAGMFRPSPRESACPPRPKRGPHQGMIAK